MANRERPGLGGRAVGIARLAGLSAWRGLVGFHQGDDLMYAASIAYYSLLSFFPFFLLVFSLFNWASSDAANRNAVLSFVLQYFPAQFDFITTQLDSLGGREVTIGVAGTAALGWGALGVFGAVSTAVNHAWGVPEQRGFWGHKLFSFLMLLVAGLVLLLALLLVSASHVVGTGWFAGVLQRFPRLSLLQGLALRNATTALLVFGVGLIYYFVPNTKVRFRDVWLGALVTGLLWKGAFALFSWSISDMRRLAQVDGSIAAVVVFLVWVYVQAAILLYGVEFTAVYARLRGEATPAREIEPG